MTERDHFLTHNKHWWLLADHLLVCRGLPASTQTGRVPSARHLPSTAHTSSAVSCTLQPCQPACPFCAGLALQAEAQPLAQEELPQGGQGYSVNRKWGCISFTSSNPWTRAGGLWPCTPWFTNTQLAHRTGWSSSPSKNTCTWLYTDVFILDFM